MESRVEDLGPDAREWGADRDVTGRRTGLTVAPTVPSVGPYPLCSR